MATRKAQKQAEQARISQIGEFKKRLGGVMTLPSGLTVKLKNPGGLRAFLGTSTIPNGLMTIIQESLDKGKGISNEKLMPGGKLDPAMLADMMSMMDIVAMQCIVEPKLHPALTEADLLVWNEQHPDDIAEDVEDLRQDDRLYVDELPDDDKQFIFSWVSGGTKDLETFRREQDRGMASLAEHASSGSDPE